MYYLRRNFVVWASLVLLSFMSLSTMAQASEIYFSEYSEPNNSAAGVHFNDRYVEIYNGSASQIDMEDYAFVSCLNNCNGTNYKSSRSLPTILTSQTPLLPQVASLQFVTARTPISKLQLKRRLMENTVTLITTEMTFLP